MYVEYTGIGGRGKHPAEYDLATKAHEVGLVLCTLQVGPWDDGKYRATFEERGDEPHGVMSVIMLHCDDTDEMIDWLDHLGRGEVWD
jgi:hypothetical protein